MRVDVLGVGFDNVTSREALDRALSVIGGGEEKSYIVTPNPEFVWISRKDAEFRRIIEGAELVLADGIGIILGAKILKTPLLERIAGIDFTCALLGELSKTGGSVYLLGAKPGVAEQAGRKLAEDYAGLIIAGASDGYFTDDEPVIKSINEAKPDLLLVCMGAPKQERWMSQNLDRLDTRLCIGLGGVVDVFAGTVKRAPRLFRRLGLEWLYRLIREPWRIKRMIKLPLFVFAVICQRFRGKIAGQ